ncbi:MAG: RDD family protein, partial [Planctomycetota bacterium]
YPRGLRDLWGADPARRLEVLPAIEASVVAASTDGETPAVLVRRSVGEDQALGVLRLDGGGWVSVGGTLRTDPDARLGLQWWSGGFHAVQFDGDGVTWHTLDGEDWVSDVVPAETGGDPSSWRLVGGWRGEFVVIDEAGESGARAIVVSRDGQNVLADLPDGEWSSTAILADPGRLVLVATGQEATEDASAALPSPGLKRRSVTVAEISLVTGSLLAMGEATASSPVSRGEFQSLALLLVGAMIIVLVVVVRPSPTAAEPVLPPGTAIAPPGRRLVASIADLLPSIFVTGIMLDITVLETLGPIALPVTGSVDIVPLLVVLALSAAHSAGGEMLTGRSLGKALTGIFVARVDPMPGASPEPGRFRPPTPGGAVLRNVLKWFLFPATAIVLSDPSGRHRGDLFARSAVLLPIPPTE